MHTAEIAKLWQRGRLREAYLASAKIVDVMPVSGHPFRPQVAPLDVARRLHEHGRVCWHNAQFSEAEHALDRAHELRTHVHGELHADTLDTLERLAALADYQMHDELAAERFERVIAGFVQLHGDDHVRVAVARRNYAAFLRTRSKRPRARELIAKARVVLDAALPPEHPDRIDALKVEAMLLIAEGDHWAGLRMAELAAKLGSRCWDHDHPFVAAAELTAANAEVKLGRYRPARKRLTGVVKVFEKSYGAHPLVGLALASHARLELAADSDLEQAEDLARRAIEVYRLTYENRALVGLAMTLFDVLVHRGKLDAAVELGSDLESRAAGSQLHGLLGRMANALVAAEDYARALPWAIKTRDLAPTGEQRDKWDVTVQRLEAHAKRS